MKQSDLNEILTKHKLWLDDEEGGKRADLRYANLRYANLRYANLRCADLQGADLQRANLRSADLRSADLRGADLQRADLLDANLRYANLRSANLDYSCFPLWCGSKGIKLDRRLFLQLLAHICAVEVDDEECKKTQEYLMPLAKQSHVAKWLFGEERG